ncbi:MAG: NADH-quinone oxidoreductase subunit NuoG [Gammaproteobacteria bacterium]|nr:NADH-quinone oxidoreductase subunit NuoG [Gammaproteobacteria bacterium]
MIELQINSHNIAVPVGTTVIQAAQLAGIYIPHFCYHKKLTVAANCRMCLVEIEKLPKPMPACATVATEGMVVQTNSAKALTAQQSVMEFLLINHPLDCPICDQGGECQLQDLAVGYGQVSSRYQEDKRVVLAKDIGPLISMEEMSRCIHCTRCVRFGTEVAGLTELGMLHRGEHSEIDTFFSSDVTSELSGNMIDLCPVGALTSKPFRYTARPWELSRRKSISPHDSTGTNLQIHVLRRHVMRVLPLVNEEINECWIADRDRFSYEGLNAPDRMYSPVRRDRGIPDFEPISWAMAFEELKLRFQDLLPTGKTKRFGLLINPNSTLEELYLANQLVRQLGSDNIDFRLRNRDFGLTPKIPWLGRSIASLATLDRVLIVGSHLTKDHPILGLKIRQATQRVQAQINVINPQYLDWNMPIHLTLARSASQWVESLRELAMAIAQIKGITSRFDANLAIHETTLAMAKSLLSGQNKAILLGKVVGQHRMCNKILAIANWIAKETLATVGFLGEAANSIGAQMVGAYPKEDGFHAQQMCLEGRLDICILWNVEPEFDMYKGKEQYSQLGRCPLVINCSPFRSNTSISHIQLPITPFTETAGSYINIEGRVQSFYPVLAPYADSRQGWVLLMQLAKLLGLEGFNYQNIEQLRKEILPSADIGHLLSNECNDEDGVCLEGGDVIEPMTTPNMYQTDAIVRRAASLRKTLDGQAGELVW